MKNSILIIGINYFPEITGIGKYTAEMAEYLVSEKEFGVTVITGNPYYPQWRIYDGYKNNIKKEIVNGITVYRSPVYIPSRPRTMLRLLQDALFLACSFMIINWLIMRRKRFDYIFIPAPPFAIGFIGLYYRFFFRKVKLIYHIQDLQIDVAKNLGMLKHKRLLGILFKLETHILKSVNYVSTISEGMKSKIQEKANNQIDTLLFPNWINNSEIFPTSPDSILKKYSWLKDKKMIFYSGAIGEKQGLEILIDTAHYFKDHEAFCFIIAGEGPYKEKLSLYAQSMGLANVIFLNLLPTNEFNEMLNAAFLHIIIQKEAGNDLFLPSKLTNILGVGGCVIVSASTSTSLYNIINNYQCGYIIPNSNLENISSSIIELSRNTELYEKIKLNARSYATTYLYKVNVIDNFLSKISQ